MDCFCCPKRRFEFNYYFTLNGEQEERCVSETILLPLDSNITIREWAFRFLKLHELSDYLLPDLLQKLLLFIEEKIDELQCNELTERLAFGPQHEEQLRDFWLHLRYSQGDSGSVENKFCAQREHFQPDNFHLMYHEIVHSGLLTPQLIQLEVHNSQVINNLLIEREQSLQNLSREQNQNIESILLSGSYSDKEINTITTNNILLAEKRRKEWKDRIATVRSQQKREFYTWIKNTYEDWIKDKDSGKQFASKQSNFGGDLGTSSPLPEEIEPEPVHLEESYTINLGSQLKTTHNLRLISVDMLKFCSNRCTPHRLQTAMSLYSSSLSAIVLLVDSSLTSYSGIKSEFAKLCMGAAENHFADLDVQLAQIQSDAERLYKKTDSVTKLNMGDVYITKHSNLSEVHLVFHLVIDESLKSPDINSRHPVILGIRNILKMAYVYDVTRISLPLLLLHQMEEDITMQWCLRRAELILKCVKGFMIEMSSLLSLNDNENKTIEFVVPKGISHDLFSSLSAIFPNVFRLSNTLFLTTGHT